eukprot:TRINITY_DN10187_c0_g1_i1.p1 TRINITY_DN10187_c0_g1~~TRINITY_DN10187_c0_g1_i1.p1  ORF type:complete len:1911 (-),score=394.98 TRINITY_DN10187_c0_g1_i1:31-5049(-)
MRRLVAGLDTEQRQISEAFRRFDIDGSGVLEANEFKHMCAYLGWGLEEMDLMDVDKDGSITLPDFAAFVGRLGGVQQLFEHRRLRISASRKDVCDHAGLAVGSRVRSHFYCHGQKSRSWREAQVLEVAVERHMDHGGLMGPVTYGVLLEFGFGNSSRQHRWRARQVVPPTWVLSSVEDASVASALREIGLLDEHQAFWALLLPETEMLAVERLEECQRKALATVRAHSTESHEKALPRVRERFRSLGYKGRELESTLGWIQDLAPVCVHVGLDRMGHFMESDDFYRNQFETKTSCGAYDDNNSTRISWERELFGGAYDSAKGFDRCKYGALNVMNDYRGVVSARQYGDSYMVLKDVRLRCTFASTDSGGLRGNRLGVLDRYAHVLAEYNDRELKGLVEVAMAATAASDATMVVPKLLRGATEDTTRDWVTVGFPEFAQETGRYFFEVHLQSGCTAPQVGLLSCKFENKPGAKSTQGVGDDMHGWAADGLNASRWHGGTNRAWRHKWPRQSSSSHALKDEVVVGVAVDTDNRQIWFSSDGVWDEVPSFTEGDIDIGTVLYPALTFMGKAAFCFGPEFKHMPPADGEAFGTWPGLTGSIRIDMPRIGNEEILSLYKEVQIHGEVDLNKHVQRLVAAQKYRDVPKTQRSYSLRVNCSGPLKGTYDREGAHNDMPFYKNHSTGALIYYDSISGMWKITDTGDFSSWQFCAARQAGIDEPPRGQWTTQDESRGVIAPEAFRAALMKMKLAPTCPEGHRLIADARPGNYCDMCGEQGTHYRSPKVGSDYALCKNCYGMMLESCSSVEVGITEEAVESLLQPLIGEVSDGSSRVFRVRGETSLSKEWSRLGSLPGDPEDAWNEAVEEAKQQLKEQANVSKGVIVETTHPYDAKRFQWRREVHMDGVDGLLVYFFSRSSTLDNRARFRIFTGGLRRSSAGIGARVEVKVPGSGGDKVWGTVIERRENGFWKVSLDVQEEGRCDAPVEDHAWPQVGDEVLAKSGLWHRATIAKICDDGTYTVDWFDKDSKDRQKRREELCRPAPEVSEHRCVEDLPRYCRVPDSLAGFALCSDVPKSVTVRYAKGTAEADEQGFGAMIGDEIANFTLDRACPLMPISVGSFVGSGPAQEQGVCVGWYLDLVATLGGTSRSKLTELLTGIGGVEDLSNVQVLIDAALHNIEEVHKRLNEGLRAMADVTLTFTDSCSPTEVTLLPEARVRYTEGRFPFDEIKQFDISGATGEITMKGFRGKGPAQRSGVRTDWVLNLRKTLRTNAFLQETDEFRILSRFCEHTNAHIDTSAPAVTPGKSKSARRKARKRAKKKKKEEEEADVRGVASTLAAHAELAGKDVEAKSPAEDGKEEGSVKGPKTTEIEIYAEWVEKDTFGEVVKTKMEAAVVELGWSGPSEIEKHFMSFDPEPKVYDSRGDVIPGPVALASCGPDSFPVRFVCKLPLPPSLQEAEVDDGDAASTADAADAADASAAEESEAAPVAPEAPPPSKEEAEASLQKFMAASDLTLVFKHPKPQKALFSEHSGPSRSGDVSSSWTSCRIPGDYVDFEFSTDGDGGDSPEKRWGVLALTMPLEGDADGSFSDEAVTAMEAFFVKWADTTVKAGGIEDTPKVERDNWDEARLRALCARHGWEFEWMTEDGERRRRAHEQWDVLKLATRPLLGDAAEPDGTVAAR